MNAIRDDQNDAGLIELLRSAMPTSPAPPATGRRPRGPRQRQVAVRRDHLNRALGWQRAGRSHCRKRRVHRRSRRPEPAPHLHGRSRPAAQRVIDAKPSSGRRSALAPTASARRSSIASSQSSEHNCSPNPRAGREAHPACATPAAMTLYLERERNPNRPKSKPVPSERALQQYPGACSEPVSKTAAAVLAQQRIDSNAAQARRSA
jgi:hypothetical protein